MTVDAEKQARKLARREKREQKKKPVGEGISEKEMGEFIATLANEPPATKSENKQKIKKVKVEEENTEIKEGNEQAGEIKSQSEEPIEEGKAEIEAEQKHEADNEEESTIDTEVKEEDGENSGKTEGTNKNKPKKGTNGIWVGNLAYTTQPQDLKEFFFNKCGEITRMHLPKATARKSVGYAYIDFLTPESCEKALQLNNTYLDHRNLMIKPANSQDSPEDALPRPKTKLNTNPKVIAQSNPPGPTIFVGNLHFDTTKDGLKEMMEEFGEVIKIRMGQWEDTGRCKGYAFVDYYETDSAKAAIAKGALYLLGKKLRLEFGSREAVRRARPWEQDEVKPKKRKLETGVAGETPKLNSSGDAAGRKARFMERQAKANRVL